MSHAAVFVLFVAVWWALLGHSAGHGSHPVAARRRCGRRSRWRVTDRLAAATLQSFISLFAGYLLAIVRVAIPVGMAMGGVAVSRGGTGTPMSTR